MLYFQSTVDDTLKLRCTCWASRFDELLGLRYRISPDCGLFDSQIVFSKCLAPVAAKVTSRLPPFVFLSSVPMFVVDSDVFDADASIFECIRRRHTFRQASGPGQGLGPGAAEGQREGNEARRFSCRVGMAGRGWAGDTKQQ